MLETTISLRVLAAVLVGVLAISLLGVGWIADKPLVAILGLALANICAVLAIQHDNAKTRRLIRVMSRSREESDSPQIRSMR